MHGFYDRVQAILIGPGLTRSDGVRELVRDILRTSPVPLVVDADSLTVLGVEVAELAQAKAPVVITPGSVQPGMGAGRS